MENEDKADRVVRVVIEQIRLPCGHAVDLPKSLNSHITCEYDNRTWHLYKKGVEWLAREE